MAWGAAWRGITNQHVLLSIGAIGAYIGGVPLATTGLVHPSWAMVAMAASVSTVLANSFLGRLGEPKGEISAVV